MHGFTNILRKFVVTLLQPQIELSKLLLMHHFKEFTLEFLLMNRILANLQ